MILGAGRATKESVVDLAVGLMLHKKIGDEVKKGDTIVTIHSNCENVEDVMECIYASYRISPTKVESSVLIHAEVQ